MDPASLKPVPEKNALSHYDETTGEIKMVDVGAKTPAKRVAKAAALVSIGAELYELLKEKRLEKGDPFAVARTAAILAAKQTDRLIPLCHGLPLDHVSVDFRLEGGDSPAVKILSEVSTTAKTGVEMEALVAVSLAALTFYDMCKSADKSITVQSLGLVEKRGGKSGRFVNESLSRLLEAFEPST